MDDLSDIRDRQDNLEGRVTQLEVTVEREASLRAKMDTELGTISAKLNAQQRSLNALAEVQSDHTRRLTRIEDRLTGVEGRLDGVETRLTGVEADLAIVKTGVRTILGLLDADPAKTSPAKKGIAGRLAGRFGRQ